MHTNNTSHYNLPQFIGSDIPNPLTDWNDSMQAIDTAMYEIKTQADEIGSDIVQDESDISDLQSQANLTDDNITLLNQQTTAARTAATDAQDAANRNASNITTLQQSVANNRTSITQYNNRFNQNVPFAFGIEEVEDPDNPGQTIEKYGYYTTDDPAVFVPFGESLPVNIIPDTYTVIDGASASVSKQLTNVKENSLIVLTCLNPLNTDAASSFLNGLSVTGGAILESHSQLVQYQGNNAYDRYIGIAIIQATSSNVTIASTWATGGILALIGYKAVA